MRKKLLGALALFTLACGCVFVACKKENDNVTLEGFENIEVNALLDDQYTLPIGNVSDTDGKDYQVVYSVKTASGKDVSLNNNAFWVKNFEDHIITCTAKISENDVRTRTITVKVKDGGAPVITFGKVKRGMVGVEYSLPEITVFDSSLETLTPSVKLYSLNGEEKGAEIVLENGKFTPTAMGYYLLEATATDSSSNTATESATVYVRAPIAVDEILSFDYFQDADNVGWSQTTGSITWLETYENEQGVVRFTYTGKQWSNAFTFVPLRDVSADATLYADYSELIVRMYISNTETYTNYFTHPDNRLVITKYTATGETLTTYQSKNTIQYNNWVDYRFDIRALTAFDMEELNVYSAKLWGYGVKLTNGDAEIAHDGEFFVSDISVAKKVEIGVTGNTGVGNSVTITNEFNDSDVIVTVTEPDGTQTTCANSMFTITQKGKHTVYVRGEGYYGQTTFTATRAYTENEFMSFDYAEDIDSAYSVAFTPTTVTLTREENYQNEAGVLKLEWNGNKWPALTVKPIQSTTAFENYNYVVIRAYVPSENPIKYLKINNVLGKVYEPINPQIYCDTWHNYVFDIKAFAEWSDDLSPQDLWDNQFKIWSEFDGVTEGALYIADISFAKKANVTVGGSTVATKTATFSFKETTQTPTVYIVNESNELIRSKDGNYTIPEKGNYTAYVFANGYYGKNTFTATRAYATNEFLSFDYAEDINSVYTTAIDATVTATIEQAFEGETGVLKLEWNGNKWPALSVKPMLSQSEYKSYKYLVIRMYVPKASPIKYLKINNIAGKAYEAIEANYVMGEWVDYKFDRAALGAWSDEYTVEELWKNQYRIWSEFDGVTAGTLYIADISFSN